MRWQLEKRPVLPGFVAAALVLVFVGWECHRDTVRVAEAAEARKSSYEVRGMLDETTMARLVDAETGQRGYLLTGEETYLEPYRQAVRNLDEVMVNLKNLTCNNPNHQKHIQALQPFIEKKLAELQQTIELRKKEGLAGANQVVLGGQGKYWMDQIRTVLEEMVSACDATRQ
jgi:CHASE3 domain sensor protein